MAVNNPPTGAPGTAEPELTPLPEIKVQPIDPGMAASQVAVDHRIEQLAAGEDDVPALVASPVAAPPRQRARTIEEIEAEMAETRQRLETTLTQLSGAVKEAVDPRNILHRQLVKVQAYYIDEYGAIRPERVMVTAGVIVGTVVVFKTTKRIFSTKK